MMKYGWIGILAIIAAIAALLAFINPEPAEGVVPLRTSDEVNEFAVGELFPCDRDDMIFQTTDNYPLPLDEFMYYGYRATTVRSTAAVPVSGHFAWRVIVDPNNHWIQELTCSYEEFPELCPKDETGEYVWIRNSILDNPDGEAYNALDAGEGVMIMGYVAFSECLIIDEWEE